MLFHARRTPTINLVSPRCVLVVAMIGLALSLHGEFARAQSSSAPPAHGVTEGLRRARACGSDNACVVRALEGRARTCAEFGLLAVAYRWTHRDRDARMIFERYLRRCGPHDEVPRPENARSRTARE